MAKRARVIRKFHGNAPYMGRKNERYPGSGYSKNCFDFFFFEHVRATSKRGLSHDALARSYQDKIEGP